MTSSRRVRLAWALAALAVVAGLMAAVARGARPPDTAFGHGAEAVATDGSSTNQRIAPLRAFERAARASADFEHWPDSTQSLGADPYDVEALGTSSLAVAILRGRDAVVLLGPNAEELDRAPAPRSPTGLAVDTPVSGRRPSAGLADVYVSGELEPRVLHYRVKQHRLEAAGSIELAGLRAIRDVAAADGRLYAVDEWRDRLVTVRLPTNAKSSLERDELPTCRAPFRVQKVESALIVGCLIDHALIVYRLSSDGRPDPSTRTEIKHDGPIWSFAALAIDGALVIASGGVENHPLDRRIGSFGFIDSFVFIHRVVPGQPSRQLAAIDVSELGVVVPKALALERDTNGVFSVEVTGYAADRRATLRFANGLEQPPQVQTRPSRPGTNAVARRADGSELISNPLLDAFVVERAGESRLVPVSDSGAPRRDPEVRLGEALVFTTLIAPSNIARGPLSRFSCETCHFEGTVDGRTHHTGRGDVRATTKPLLGLFPNRPYFSRALDPDLAKMAHNEFRVAGAGSGTDPWFSVRSRDVPWLADLGIDVAELDPERLRRSLMAFLMQFSPRPNPLSAGRSELDASERAGAALFARRCESCHAARLVTDEPESHVAPERWESLIFVANAPIVWARAEREKTGVLPYVHPDGARVPSLRRLFRKRPYFTNGSAPDLATLLERARYDDRRFFHDSAPNDAALRALTGDERRALLAFLDLL